MTPDAFDAWLDAYTKDWRPAIRVGVAHRPLGTTVYLQHRIGESEGETEFTISWLDWLAPSWGIERIAERLDLARRLLVEAVEKAEIATGGVN